MKTIIVFILCLFFACSCDTRRLPNGKKIPQGLGGDKDFSVVVIDGCEYLTKYNGYQLGVSFCHKGDCKNPIHYKVIHDTIYVMQVEKNNLSLKK